MNYMLILYVYAKNARKSWNVYCTQGTKDIWCIFCFGLNFLWQEVFRNIFKS